MKKTSLLLVLFCFSFILSVHGQSYNLKGTVATNWNSVLTDNTCMDIATGKNTGIGRVDCIEFDKTNKNIIYVGTTGGLWRTNDSGASWQNMTDLFNIYSVSDIAIAPDNNTIYIASGDANMQSVVSRGVYKSTDHGISWNISGLQFEIKDNVYINSLLISKFSPNIIFAATTIGVFKSQDAGLTWKHVLTNHNIKDLEFNATKENFVYCTSFNINGGARFFESTDYGDDFVISEPTVYDNTYICRIELATSEKNPNLLYALTVDKNSHELNSLFISIDSGKNWSLKSNLSEISIREMVINEGDAHYNITILISPINSAEIIIGAKNIWKSSDTGINFNLNNNSAEDNVNWVHAGQLDIKFNALDSTIYLANDGGLYKSTDLGNTWQNISEKMNISQILNIDISKFNANYIIATRQNNSILLTDKDIIKTLGLQQTWSCALDYSNNNIFYYSTNEGEIFKTTDKGLTFQNITPQKNDSIFEGKYNIKIDKKNPNVIYAINKKLYKTINSGETWIEMKTPKIEGRFYEVELSSKLENVFYLTSSEGIFLTKDGSRTWRNITADIPTANSQMIDKYLFNYYDLEINNDNPYFIWLTVADNIDNKKVFKTDDAGQTWKNVSYNLSNIKINCINIQNGKSGIKYIGTDNGVFVLDEINNTWIDCSANLPKIKIMDIEIDYINNKLIVATYGRGIWSIDMLNTEEFVPYSNFTISNMTPCLNDEVFLYDLSTYSPVKWRWEITPNSFVFLNNTNKNSQNPVIKFFTGGVYSITLTTENKNGTTSMTKSDYLFVGKPMADFDYILNSKEVNFFNTSVNATTCSWQFGDGQTDNNYETSHNYLHEGIYKVLLTVYNRCGTSEIMKNVYVTTNIYNIDDQKISCFPTLVEDNIFINNNLATQKYQITIYDISGRPLTTEEQLLSIGKNNYDINIQQTGYYILKIEKQDFVKSFYFFKQ